MELPKTSGIYLIQTDKDCIYIGQAENIHIRIRKHFDRLAANKHRNSRLQNIYNKYGRNVFQVHVLNECPIDQLDKYEQEWLDLIREYPSECVLNQCFEPHTTRGYKFTDKQRKEQSDRLKGKKKPVGFGDRISESNKIKWASGVMKPKPRKQFCVVNPDGIIYQVNGLSDFSKQHNLSAGTLHMLISNKIKVYRGWRSFPTI